MFVLEYIKNKTKKGLSDNEKHHRQYNKEIQKTPD